MDYKVNGFFEVNSTNFDNEDQGDLTRLSVLSDDGDLRVTDMEAYTNARFSVEYYSERPQELQVRITVNGSMRITVDDTQVFTTGYGQNITVPTATLPVHGGWNRLDFYYYTEWGGGFRVEGVTKPMGRYFTSWRDPAPGAPTWVSLSGADGELRQEGQIELSWRNSGLLGAAGGTAIYGQASGDASFTLLTRVQSDTVSYTHTGLLANKAYTYKLQHYNDRGDLSPFSAENTGWTATDVGADGDILQVSTGQNYYTTGDTMVITVLTGQGGAFVGLDGEPTVLVGGATGATLDSQSSDGYYTESVFNYSVSTGDTEGVNTITVSATTLGGTDVSGTTTVGFDFVAPVLVSAASGSTLVMDSDDDVFNGAVKYTTAPTRVYLHHASDIADTSGDAGWSSGIKNILWQNAFVGSGVGSTNTMKDASVANKFAANAFTGYILRDSAGNEFNITGFDETGAEFNLSGTPASGAYAAYPASLSSPGSWNSTTFTRGAPIMLSLCTGMPYRENTIPADLPETHGFRVYMAAEDNAGNISNVLYDDMHYSTQATNAAIIYHKFVDAGGNEVEPNENNWFDDSDLRIKIFAESIDGNVTIDSIYYRIDGGSYTLSAINAPKGSFTVVLPDGVHRVEYYATTSAANNASQTRQVDYQLDYTAPTWKPGSTTLVGGFERVAITWSNAPSDSTGSGIDYIEIHRNTSSATGTAVLVAETDNNYKGFVDTEIDDAGVATKYWYWAKAVDYAGNKSGLKSLGGPVNAEPIVAADVDGALRINSPNNTIASSPNWEVRYGIKVPIEAVTIRVGKLESDDTTVNEIDAIQYSTDGDSWSNVTSPTIHGESVTFPYSITGDTVYSIAFTPVQDKEYWRVVFDGDVGGPPAPVIGTQIDDVHFDSLLAADLIVAGVLRLATGMTIWSGAYDSEGNPTNTGGAAFDSTGLRLFDSSGNTVIALYNTAVGGNIATFGLAGRSQIAITSDGKAALAVKDASGNVLVQIDEDGVVGYSAVDQKSFDIGANTGRAVFRGLPIRGRMLDMIEYQTAFGVSGESNMDFDVQRVENAGGTCLARAGCYLDGYTYFALKNHTDTADFVIKIPVGYETGTIDSNYSDRLTIGDGKDPHSVITDGTNIWVSCETSRELKKITPSLSVSATYSTAAGYEPKWLAYDGTNIWTSADERIYYVNATTGSGSYVTLDGGANEEAYALAWGKGNVSGSTVDCIYYVSQNTSSSTWYLKRINTETMAKDSTFSETLTTTNGTPNGNALLYDGKYLFTTVGDSYIKRIIPDPLSGSVAGIQQIDIEIADPIDPLSNTPALTRGLLYLGKLIVFCGEDGTTASGFYTVDPDSLEVGFFPITDSYVSEPEGAVYDGLKLWLYNGVGTGQGSYNIGRISPPL